MTTHQDIKENLKKLCVIIIYQSISNIYFLPVFNDLHDFF